MTDLPDTSTIIDGRYRVLHRVGSGGMADVVCAEDLQLGRKVAIKLLHRRFAQDEEFVERFRREASSAAGLQHPNVVAVYDRGAWDDTYYIAMEYLEGRTLKRLVQEEAPLAPEKAIELATQILRAARFAHKRGIIHRDLKPHNVIIDAEGRAKVTDFGIAKAGASDMTQTGSIMGTAQYLSPEQAQGHAVTGQSDLYSLGIVLFEMLTGDVPFRGENQVAVAMKHVREQLPDVQARRPEVSSALAAVIDRATAKDTADRYATDAELIADLEQVLAYETQRSGQVTGEATAVLRTLPSKTRRGLPARVTHPVRLILALLVIAGVAVAAVLLLADHTHRGTQQRSIVPTPKTEKLEPVSLGQSRAHDFDPYGDRTEHHRDIGRVLDDDHGTTWSTESYDNGQFPSDKPGVGFYIDARPGVAGRQLDVLTTTPGWQGKVYVSNSVDTSATSLSGWRDIGATIDATRKAFSVQLDTARQKFRYYLVWITRLPPPAVSGRSHVGIAEVVLQA